MISTITVFSFVIVIDIVITISFVDIIIIIIIIIIVIIYYVVTVSCLIVFTGAGHGGLATSPEHRFVQWRKVCRHVCQYFIFNLTGVTE